MTPARARRLERINKAGESISAFLCRLQAFNTLNLKNSDFESRLIDLVYLVRLARRVK